MASRINVRNILLSLGDNIKLYFQPPETEKMVFPCIRYNLKEKRFKYANNIKYLAEDLYSCIYISNKFDEDMLDKICNLPGVMFDRMYKVNNLYHVSFIIRVQSINKEETK